MMRKKIAAAVVTLFLLLATYGILLAYFSMHEKQTPRAEDGAMDATSWRFAEDGVIPLDGEWELYPNELLSPPNFLPSFKEEGRARPAMIRVPGSWSSQMDTLGMATYRLRIKVGDTGPIYGLKTSSIQISNRIVVNGNNVGASGNPDERLKYEALNRPYVAYFNLQSGWNEIIVQVANYDFPASSGINESIFLGSAAQIAALRDKATAHDWITVAAFLIIGLYFIGLYSQRKSDLSLLVFGLVSVCSALFISTRGERVLYDLLGAVPFWLVLRIQMVSATGVGIGFLLYVRTAFRPYCSDWIVRVGLFAGTLLAVLSAGFATTITTDLFRQLTTIYATFPLIYATYVFVLAAFNRVEGGAYLAVAAIVLNAFALTQNLNIYFGVPIYTFAPFEPFLFLLMLALLMSLRFSNAFRKIEELSVQLLRADKLKDDFLARTSHEFKTPLHGVMNISRSMLEDTADPPSAGQREKLQLIASIMSRLSQLVYDILDFSRLKQGELAIHPASVDVRSAVEMQVRIYSYLCENRNVRIDNRVPERLPYAFADESRFSQIIGNLLDNAVKHTANGSIVVTAAEKRGMIEISVQDTGEGIEASDIPVLFEPFKSIDTTSERRGFGLGLSIAKQLVELQNGAISVISMKGAGSTFTFTLPVADERKETKPVHPSTSGRITPKELEYAFATPYESNRNGKHTILIVDDQFINLKILMDALQPLDYRVIALKSGFEALEQIDKPGKIDLVILDLMMPGMSGYEVCQEIRKRYTLLELPILMVTAAIQPQDKVAAFQAGANDYLPKPFDLEELKARIGSLLAMKQSLGKAINLEVAFLQSQIKPHFLYNVLNTVVSSSYTDVERARTIIVDLADYLRGSFRFGNIAGRISFKEEFGLIRTYVDLERVRFKNRIRFEYDIAETAYHVQLPPLLLQPLIENAIRHGIGERSSGGTVTLTAHEAEGMWRFVVADDGVGIERERIDSLLGKSGTGERQGVGLLNIDKRLKHEYGMMLKIESELGRGTKVTVQIPQERL